MFHYVRDGTTILHICHDGSSFFLLLLRPDSHSCEKRSYFGALAASEVGPYSVQWNRSNLCNLSGSNSSIAANGVRLVMLFLLF